MKLISIIFLMISGFSAFGTTTLSKIEVNRVMDATDFPESTTQKLMGVANGEILLFSTRPSESLLVDCKEGSGKLNYSSFSEGEESVRQDFAFDSIEKCESFSALVSGDKDQIGVSTRVEINLDFINSKIKSIHFSEDL